MRSLVLPFFALVAAACAAADATNRPVAAPLPAEAARLGDLYRAGVVRLAAQYKEAVKALPGAYLARLTALQKELQESGDLEGYLAADKEVKRFSAAIRGEADPFEKVPEMPESAVVAAPEKLRALQTQYLKVFQERADRRRKQIEDLATAYIAKLEDLQKELTRGSHIQDAFAVKQEVDRLRKAVKEDNFVQQALAAEAPAARVEAVNPAPAAPETAVPTFGRVPDWAKWQFERTGNFAWQGFLFRHPDLPDELDMEFDARVGQGRVRGRCMVDRVVIDGRESAWFGKAVTWKASDPATLNATIVLQSREISAGKDSGPYAVLAILGDKGRIGESLDVPLAWNEVTIALAKDPAANRCALVFPQGKVRKFVDLPAGGTLHVLLAVVAHNPGEQCDTSFSMQ
jgi:hypothetical protein